MKGYHDSKTKESIRDLWRTPKAIFNYYNRRFEFNCDVAASSSNNLCYHYIDENSNALESEWMKSSWCNPPYSDIAPWVMKAISEKAQGRLTVMLLPADTSVKWFKLAFDNCSECHFISGRLAFINDETGKPVSGNNKGSVVFIFDPCSPLKSTTVLLDRNEMMRG